MSDLNDVRGGYDLLVHRHRFAAWAAARAAQSSRLNGAFNPPLIGSIEWLGFPESLESIITPINSAELFDAFHRRNCGDIVRFLAQKGLKTSYGIAAKLLAIYLKSMVIIGPWGNLKVAELIHPPIDSFLLEGIQKDKSVSKTLQSLCKRRWTQLDEREYFELVTAFRGHGLDRPAFWMIERHWNPLSIGRVHHAK